MVPISYLTLIAGILYGHPFPAGRFEEKEDEMEWIVFSVSLFGLLYLAGVQKGKFSIASNFL